MSLPLVALFIVSWPLALEMQVEINRERKRWVDCLAKTLIVLELIICLLFWQAGSWLWGMVLFLPILIFLVVMLIKEGDRS